MGTMRGVVEAVLIPSIAGLLALTGCVEHTCDCGDGGAPSIDAAATDTDLDVDLPLTVPVGFWLMAGQQFACVGTSDTAGGICWGNSEELSEVPELFFGQVEGTYMFSAGIDTEGTLQYWGKNDDCDDLTTNPTGYDYASFDLDWDHACAVTDQRTVWCWGNNSWGQTSPPDSADFVQVAVGDRDSCGLRENGTIVCWGLMAQHDISFPEGKYRQLSGGNDHFCALRYDVGEIECISNENLFGEADPPAGIHFRMVASGGSHSCAIREDNSIACWGFDTYGESTPPDRHFATVSLGQWSSCGLDLLGGIYCWGLSVDNVPPELDVDAFAEYVSLFL